MTDHGLKLLKSHIKGLRKSIEQHLREGTHPRAVALQLFDIWKQDLEKGKILKDGCGRYVSSEPLSLQQLQKKFEGSTSGLKPHVTHAREGLQSYAAPIAGHIFSFDITKRRYSLCVAVAADPLASRRLVWAPYIGKVPIIVASVKRLFFKINKDVYIRNITVDNVDSWDKCDVLTKLVTGRTPHAVRMYAPSGEMAAAFELLDLFNNQLGLGAKGDLISPEYHIDGMNLVVLGSGIEEPHYVPPPELGFSFKNLANGVKNEGKGTTLEDEVTDATLKVHVIVQRWHKDDGNVITVIYASHAAAVEAIVNHLVAEKPAARLIKKFPWIEDWLTTRVEFECVFVVELEREGRTFHPRSVSVLTPQTRAVSTVRQANRAQRALMRRALTQ